MAIETVCPRCNQSYRLRDHYAGATVRCRKCGDAFPVESAGEDGAPDTAATPATGLKRASPGLMLALTFGPTLLLLSCCIIVPIAIGVVRSAVR
jgi:predicted Zn finger-like uncharacterized protein